jgi:5,10-methylenetetrahydromethanopterin reductase
VTEAIEVGIVIEPRNDVRETVNWAKLAEANGYELLGITDGQMIWRDAWVALTASAVATERIQMGPWVTNPVTRHMAVIANFIATLDELSGGRAVLGIGNGDDAVRTIGSSPAKLAELATIVDIIRDLMVGKEVLNQSKVGWRIATGSPDRDIPIYWAGANPKSLDLGTRHADGLVISGFIDDGWLAETLATIRASAADSGRQPKLIFNSAVSVDPDGARAREAVRPYVASGLRYLSSARVEGWSEEDVQQQQAAYDSYHHFRDSNAAAVARVPEHMIPKKSISGTPQECAALMQSVIDSGISNFALMAMGDVDRTIELLAQEVRPLLRPAASVPVGALHGA